MNKAELDKMYENVKIKENLIIARVARKTIRYIEKNIINFPKEYNVLRDNIIASCYDILKCIYRANILQEINDKKEIIINICMLNFYLEEAYLKKIISKRKFEIYVNHLIGLDKMTRSWLKYEKSE